MSAPSDIATFLKDEIARCTRLHGQYNEAYIQGRARALRDVEEFHARHAGSLEAFERAVRENERARVATLVSEHGVDWYAWDGLDEVVRRILSVGVEASA